MRWHFIDKNEFPPKDEFVIVYTDECEPPILGHLRETYGDNKRLIWLGNDDSHHEIEAGQKWIYVYEPSCGKWKQVIYDKAILYACSYCGAVNLTQSYYCPNCGLKMIRGNE